MHYISDTRRLLILGLKGGPVIALSLFIVLSAVVHHVVLAAVLVFVGIVATAIAWFLRQQIFFLLGGGGIAISGIGSVMFLYAGLYLEFIAAIAVTFFGGVLLAVLVMTPRLVWGRHLSAEEQQREIQKFRRRYFERTL